MEELKAGSFFGQTNRTFHLDGILLTDTEYTVDKVDWHYHENAYFTFILAGQILEGNRKEKYHCAPGSLLFHNWQEPHYNIKPEGYTRGFHLEIQKEWFRELLPDSEVAEGSMQIDNPTVKLLFYQIFKETRLQDTLLYPAVESLLLQAFTTLLPQERKVYKNPPWVARLKELLHDRYPDTLSLKTLAAEVNIHPVHLSRDFPKYFHCSLGDYIRKVRTQKSFSLFYDKERSLTEIALQCGFSDQSHFTRSFKALNGLTPSAFRKIMLER
ncbi:helix-turn-helix domain-containing protein [Pontibacter lucknowensis]|uniref:Transcriptional regulator, AraC family n=1 Tax=Pontibacter lucknowensis TaxID=1077936 RepID=A0A1N6W295_9BACT|nr:AraC family transcriptional regulator [Pontibacter lucknowensis]SIQ84194.1 transcriptional regulator, AraC family [Pontibacter lucknowensis]